MTKKFYDLTKDAPTIQETGNGEFEWINMHLYPDGCFEGTTVYATQHEAWAALEKQDRIMAKKEILGITQFLEFYGGETRTFRDRLTALPMPILKGVA